mgnify:CR=1 FL=1
MIEFCIWTKIKDDSRFLETPKIIAEKMTQLQQVAEDFIAIKQVAIRELNGCWKESQIKFGIEPRRTIPQWVSGILQLFWSQTKKLH